VTEAVTIHDSEPAVPETVIEKEKKELSFVNRMVMKVADLLHDGTPEGEWDDDVSKCSDPPHGRIKWS